MNGANVHQASGLSQKRVGEIIQGGSAVHQTSKMVSVEILFSDLKFNDTPLKGNHSQQGLQASGKFVNQRTSTSVVLPRQATSQFV